METYVGRSFDYGPACVVMSLASNILVMSLTTFSKGRVETNEKVEGF